MAKKLLALLLVFVFAFSLAACGEDATENGSKSSETASTAGNVASSEETGEVESNDEKTDEADSQTEETGSKTESKTSSTGSTGSTNSTNSTNSTSSTVSTGRPGGTTGNRPGAGNSNGNQSGQANITAAVEGLKVKEGKSLVDGLNFKGKTFTMAITEEGQYKTNSFKRCITAFEKKYNCKITTKELSFATYNQQVAQAKTAGKPYDICYAHGSMFPACAIDEIYNDLSDSLRTSDLMDNNNPTAGGIDLPKTSYFVYKNKIYGTCNFSSCFPYVIYYNKVLMAEAGYTGNSDPRKLAENNRWNWSTIQQWGRKLTDVSADKYFLSNSFCGRGISLAYGAPIVTVSKGVYKENITSKGYMASLKLMQDFFVGNRKIAEPKDGTHPYMSYETMLRGSAYMFTEETSKYLDMAKEVVKSSAFNRNKANIGIVAMPLGETNTKKAYPTGWLTAVCSGAGKGSNELVAIAWEVFRSQYVDPATDPNAMSAADKKYTDSLLMGDISCEVGRFSNSETDTIQLTEHGAGIVPSVIAGADVSKQVTAVKDKMTDCINTTLSK